MELFLEKENKTQTIELEKPTSIKEILKDLNISNESIIISKNGEICLEDEIINNDDKIKLFSVVSGG